MPKKDTHPALARSSRIGAFVSALGAVIALGALVYAGIQLKHLDEEIVAKRQEVEKLEQTASEGELKIRELQERIENLEVSQADILDFFSEVMSRDNIERFDPSVDWSRVKSTILDLPAGDRKKAVLLALLYAWKDVPFTMGGESLAEGFDSPRFIRRVLEDVGVTIETEPGTRLSVSLMTMGKKIEDPMPGDLVFFEGIVGNFGFIVLAPDDGDQAAVGVGTLQKIAPLQVISMANINTPHFPMIGYFRVVYQDEVDG